MKILKVSVIKILLFFLFGASLFVHGQPLRRGFYYGSCDAAIDSAKLDIQNQTIRFHTHSGGAWNDRENQLFDSLALADYKITVINNYDLSTECYNKVISAYFYEEKGVNFWRALNEKFDSLTNPAQLKYTSCDLAKQYAEMDLSKDSVNYFHFGDFSERSMYFRTIDSLASQMHIRLVSSSYHQPLECYNEVIKGYYKEEKGIEDVWIYLNIKTDSLVRINQK